MKLKKSRTLSTKRVDGRKAIAEAALVRFANRTRHRRYQIDFTCPEFTCVCPASGFPDFATLFIRYVPREWCVELKSLKLYLNGFRDEGVFHEDVVNLILDELGRPRSWKSKLWETSMCAAISNHHTGRQNRAGDDEPKYSVNNRQALLASLLIFALARGCGIAPYTLPAPNFGGAFGASANPTSMIMITGYGAIAQSAFTPDGAYVVLSPPTACSFR